MKERPLTKPYPWDLKYTKALNTGVRIGKLIVRAEAGARAALCRSEQAAYSLGDAVSRFMHHPGIHPRR